MPNPYGPCHVTVWDEARYSTSGLDPSHSGATKAVFVLGTNFNAAASLPPATALVAAGYRALLLDVPGQPGLSSGGRGLSGGRVPWYGAWLSEVIERIPSEPVMVMGHSFGAAIALSSDSPRIERPVLVSPGGLTRLRLTLTVLAASAAWFLRPAPTHSARLLRAMLAPGHSPREELVDWMRLVAQHSRSRPAPTGAHRPHGPVRTTARDRERRTDIAATN
ncbi:alpha/beta fold hydrolase [Streptomyces lavendulae]|uniref:alpha/beta fold hydrolase n=1 Tax=Streptomyces lavendulae TaxID=1914 RepID=UPI0031E535BE